MEGRLHHAQRPLRTNGDVLQTYQLSCHIPTVMFFRLTNSPAIFQWFMNDSFRDTIAEGWLVIYMDDLLIFSPDEETHRERTKCVLQPMTELDIHLKLEKCRFATTEVEYLGMIVKPGQLAMDPVKLDGIASWPTPEKVKDIRSFLGFANFYRRFIPNYSNVARPLIDLTKKNLPWSWSSACQNSFDTLKSLFLSKPVLHIPDLAAPFAIATDASKYASSALLLQTDSNGKWHPCSCQRRDLPPTATQPSAGSGKEIPEGGGERARGEVAGFWNSESGALS